MRIEDAQLDFYAYQYLGSPNGISYALVEEVDGIRKFVDHDHTDPVEIAWPETYDPVLLDREVDIPIIQGYNDDNRRLQSEGKPHFDAPFLWNLWLETRAEKVKKAQADRAAKKRKQETDAKRFAEILDAPDKLKRGIIEAKQAVREARDKQKVQKKAPKVISPHVATLKALKIKGKALEKSLGHAVESGNPQMVDLATQSLEAHLKEEVRVENLINADTAPEADSSLAAAQKLLSDKELALVDAKETHRRAMKARDAWDSYPDSFLMEKLDEGFGTRNS